MMALDTAKQVFFFSLLLYIMWYFHKIAHRPKLYYSENATTSFIIRNCRALHSKYHPLFLFHSPYLQLVIAGLFGRLYPKICKPVFKRQLFTLSDGQQIAMDWILSNRFIQNPGTKPIVIGLYGVSGDRFSLNVLRYCKLLSDRKGFGAVIVGRRGHEVDIPLTVPKMSAFGLQQDLHECLLNIHSKYPFNPFVLLGDSAGTGFWVRYIGDLSICCKPECKRKFEDKTKGSDLDKLNLIERREFKNAQRIYDQLLCSVLISPGYDTGTLIPTMNALSQRLLLSLMKQTYVRNHFAFLKKHNASVITECDTTTDIQSFYEKYHGEMSGYKSYEQWLQNTNPTTTAQFAQCPALIINARDDPICTAKILDQWKWLFTERDSCPNAILCETQYGSHCAFFSAMGRNWLDQLILEYVDTVYEWRRKNLS